MNPLKTLAAKQASLASGTATSRELVEASLAAATDPWEKGRVLSGEYMLDWPGRLRTQSTSSINTAYLHDPF
jgi:hypothetical protein